MFTFTRRDPGVVFAFTNRYDGVSGAPFESLNLGQHVGDDPSAVAENVMRVKQALGTTRLQMVRQCHGTTVVETSGTWPNGDAPEADAMLTRVEGVALAVVVADCVPVLLAAPGQGWVAAVHAGRAGMMSGVVRHTVEALRTRGVTDLHAVVGPSICPACYEVPAELRDAAAAAQAEAAGVTHDGRPAIDVAGAVVAQLASLDVQVLDWLRTCTREDDSLYSHRRGNPTGRSAGIVMLTGAQ